MPLKTRDGVADAPIEPGLRTLCEPCDRGPLEKLCRLIVPWKPLPIADPGDLDLVARLEDLDRDGLALDRAVDRAAELDERPVGADAEALQMPELGPRELPLRHRVERELHGVVAVGRDALRPGRPGTGPPRSRSPR